jgi:hypothetical protein
MRASNNSRTKFPDRFNRKMRSDVIFNAKAQRRRAAKIFNHEIHEKGTPPVVSAANFVSDERALQTPARDSTA